MLHPHPHPPASACNTAASATIDCLTVNNNIIIFLQSHFRRCLVRMQLIQKYSAAVKIQGTYRGHLVRRRCRQHREDCDRSLPLLQRYLRGVMCRRDRLKVAHLEWSSARRVQAWYRGRSTRAAYRAVRNILWGAACVVSRHCRGFTARRHLGGVAKVISGVRCVQQVGRGFVLRRRLFALALVIAPFLFSVLSRREARLRLGKVEAVARLELEAACIAEHNSVVENSLYYAHTNTWTRPRMNCVTSFARCVLLLIDVEVVRLEALLRVELQGRASIEEDWGLTNDVMMHTRPLRLEMVTCQQQHRQQQQEQSNHYLSSHCQIGVRDVPRRFVERQQQQKLQEQEQQEDTRVIISQMKLKNRNRLWWSWWTAGPPSARGASGGEEEEHR